MAILNACAPRPNAVFSLAIEEGEAWIFGDIAAIRKTYPNARERLLSDYVNDSICGYGSAWLTLYSLAAHQLCRDRDGSLSARRTSMGVNITPHIDFESNKSPSFSRFRDKVRTLLGLVEKTA